MPENFRKWMELKIEANPWALLDGGDGAQIMAIIEACDTQEQARACLTSNEVRCLQLKMGGDVHQAD